MKPKSLYLVLCIAGTVFPYSQLVPFLREHGLGVSLGLPLFLYMREGRLESSTRTGLRFEV